MARKGTRQPREGGEVTEQTPEAMPSEEVNGATDDDLVPEGKLVCSLTGEFRPATPQEETLQSVIEQLHREYGVAMEDMERDVRVSCESEDSRSGRPRTRTRTLSLAVFESAARHEPQNIVRAALVASPATKPDSGTLAVLEDVLGNLDERHSHVYGLWTNGTELEFRMRTLDRRTGLPRFTPLTDIPAPDETLEDLEKADRRPLRVAAGDSLLRTFKRCHDYLYGNQSMRGDRAFWQLLYLIFCKIHDEKGSQRLFFVGATEANSDEGRKQIAGRIRTLFADVQQHAYKDVFDGSERLDLNDRALAFVAGELSRYSLLGTDADAKGLAYEAITSTTLKRERGQFFTPRNVIRMMVDMVDPKPGQTILDPACGSGGFLVVALAHVRKQLLAKAGANPDIPVPSELKRVEVPLRRYAESCLYGIDVDPDLRKAARMNMVMNNDGHGNIFCFNSLEYGVPVRRSPQMDAFEGAGGGHDQFDYLFTNPPFGSKIPVSDQEVLGLLDLGHWWSRSAGTWQRGHLQKKVPPEILFIEACARFLKPGTGIMAIVLPNGILGNPGEQMEGVRAWMLRHLELLASIDLPGEAFLPQVSVQASCVFLRRRHEDELRLLGPAGPSQKPVFMAIAEQVGHGRRGDTRYRRGPDGMETYVVQSQVERWERHGTVVEKLRSKKVRELADDLPWIARQYRHFVAGEAFEKD